MAEHLRIDHVGHRGDGVALPRGERCSCPIRSAARSSKLEPLAGHPDRRQLLRIDQRQPERIAPFCQYFGVCGGCAIQHWQPERYRAWKRQIVVDTLAHAGIECAVDELVDAHGAGRRRITVHARRGGDGALRVGFAAAGSHAIIAIDDCPILDPGAARRARCGACASPRSEARRRSRWISRSPPQSNGLDIDVRGSGPLPSALIATLSQLAEQHELARLTRHGELVLMRAPPVVAIGSAQVTLPPGSFLQATAAGEEALAELVTRTLQGRQTYRRPVLRGRAFRLAARAKARVSAFDSDAGAIAALQKGRDGDIRTEAGQSREPATCSGGR